MALLFVVGAEPSVLRSFVIQLGFQLVLWGGSKSAKESTRKGSQH